VRDKSEDNSGWDSEQIRVIVYTTPRKALEDWDLD
jgi:hypothetical protein